MSRSGVSATAEARTLDAARRDVIDALILSSERETAIAGLAATADICARLVGRFGELLEAFDALADAPRSLSGHEPTEDVEAHTKALRAASALSAAVVQRAQLADAAQESDDIGPDIIWLILAPQAETTRDQVNAALTEFKECFPQTLTEWDQLRSIGLHLAQVGEIRHPTPEVVGLPVVDRPQHRRSWAARPPRRRMDRRRRHTARPTHQRRCQPHLR